MEIEVGIALSGIYKHEVVLVFLWVCTSGLFLQSEPKKLISKLLANILAE